MSIRCPDLPLLPGLTFNQNVGKERFPLDPKFDFIGKDTTGLIEKVKPNMFGPLSDKYPSLYPRGECVELPGWIVFDKKILCFDGFFQETLQEVKGSPFLIRKVKIYLFLEDSTIQVVEPRVDNSGLNQGILISRQRIRFSPPMEDNFYDILDFNIGKEVELYGKVFKIIDCDRFTRTFLNRCGITVPDAIIAPVDPYMDNRYLDKSSLQPKKPNRTTDTLGKFLANDRKVLHFKGYWDDQNTEFGYVHHLEIRYYLADDTIEIKELQSETGGEPGFMFLKRGKLPKVYKELPSPGHNSTYTVLNVLGSALTTRRYIIDPLNCGKEKTDFYTGKDLTIGAIINCFGRRIVLTDCDSFTRNYFGEKYGISEFTPLQIPDNKKVAKEIPIPKYRELPPWNGFGSYEDSAQNCITVEPKPPHKDFKKFLTYDRDGLDSHILRFQAKMRSNIPENCERSFIISFYLTDDTISVYEIARRNSGFSTATFFKRNSIVLPGQKVYTSKPPKCYTPQHMFIGATILVNSFEFILTDADEYTMRFMELNPGQFPKANLKLIMEKVKERLSPIYKDFVAENIPTETPIITYERLRSKLCQVMGPDFTEHEMVTIARKFSAVCYKERFDREKIRAIALTDLKRFLWDDLERLREYFLLRDHHRCGKLSRKDCYTILKGGRLPFDNSLIEKILDTMKKDEECNIYYEDLLNFLNSKYCPPTDALPINIKYELGWTSEKKPDLTRLIDWCGFNKALDLERTFSETANGNTVEALENKQFE